jgi:uncharacterized RDD family membrane protein YckC
MNGGGSENARLDTSQAVELAEGVEVRLRTAGPFPRAMAWILDMLITMLVMIGFSLAMLVVGVVVGMRVGQGLILLGSFLVTWWYPVIFEAGKRGATPGKRAMGLRVVQTTGVPINFGQAVVRNFLRFVDLQPLGTGLVGMASCLASRRFQRLGDLAAGTVVVYERRATPLRPPSVPVRSHALRPPVALRPEEARALIAFRERARDWSEARRRELAGHLAPLTGEKATKEGVAKAMAMAQWLQEGR